MEVSAENDDFVLPNDALSLTNDDFILRSDDFCSIAHGEELTIPYGDITQKTEYRQSKFNKVYGFKCGCLR